MLAACTPTEAPDSALHGVFDSARDTGGRAWEDVVVIGAGPAGLAVAAEVGALVLEASDAPGGDAPPFGALAFLVGIPEQEEDGFQDSVEAAATDWPALTGGEANEDVVAFLAANTAVRDRLVGLGFALLPAAEDPILHRRRYFRLDAGDTPFSEVLQAALQPSTQLRLSTRVSGIAVEDGRAVGVEVDGVRIAARHVVIACGGYGARADLLAPVAENPVGAWGATVPGMGGLGDALDWAAAQGWATRNTEAVGWFWDSVGLQGAAGTMLGLGEVRGAWIWVGSDGARFVNETQAWSVDLSTPYRAHQPVWGIVSQDDLLAGRSGKDVAILEAAMEEGTVLTCSGDTRALARAAGIDADGLERELAMEANLREVGGVGPFGRDAATLPALEGTICAFLPGQLAGKTFGGVGVDAEGRVLDEAGAPVPGLWAVGEAAGMMIPGLGGRSGFDGSLSAVLLSGWRTGAAIRAELEASED